MKNPWSGFGWITAFGILLFAFLYVPSEHRQNTDCAKYYSGQTIEGLASVRSDNEVREARSQNNDAKKEKREFEIACSDLAAQWAVADYTHKAFWVGLVGIGFIFLTLRHTREAADSARETVLVTREIGQKQTRAYIVATFSYPTKLEAMDTVRFGASISNVGQSSALKINVYFSASLIAEANMTNHERMTALFDEANQVAWGESLQTNETKSVGHTWENSEFAKDPMSVLESKGAALVLALKVTYEDVFGDAHVEESLHRLVPFHGGTRLNGIPKYTKSE